MRKVIAWIRSHRALTAVLALVVAVSLIATIVITRSDQSISPNASVAPNPDGQKLYPVTPYVDPAQAVKAGSIDFYKVPWRAWMNTVPASSMLDGIGMVTAPQTLGKVDQLFDALSHAGVKLTRIELGWAQYVDANGKLTVKGKQTIDEVVSAAAKYHIRIIFLFNANDRSPGPHTDFTLATAAPYMCADTCSSLSIQLASVEGIKVGYTGINLDSGLTKNNGKALKSQLASSLITALDTTTNTVTLSQPLAKAVPAGTTIELSTLSYLPLYPVGTSQFDETARGWVDGYVKPITDELNTQGFNNYALEMWNELTFGSAWLDIAHYFDPVPAALDDQGKGRFQQGGSPWELANRTAQYMHDHNPDVELIWGFSNTDIAGTPPSQLPAYFGAKSNHPYGESFFQSPDALERHQNEKASKQATKDSDKAAKKAAKQAAKPEEGASSGVFQPDLQMSIPESIRLAGTAGVVVQQFITRMFNPVNRQELGFAPGEDSFDWYFTEQGLNAKDVDITNAEESHELKTRYMLRNYAFWLNKGLKGITMFTSWDKEDDLQGLTPSIDPASEEFTAAALKGQELTALSNYVAQFAGAVAIGKPRQIGVDVSSFGKQQTAFSGGSDQPDMPYRNLFAFLPYQVNDHRFVIPAYIMSLNGTKRLDEQSFALTIHNVNGTKAAVSWFDPISNKTIPVRVTSRTTDSISVALNANDSVRQLTIDELG